MKVSYVEAAEVEFDLKLPDTLNPTPMAVVELPLGFTAVVYKVEDMRSHVDKSIVRYDIYTLDADGQVTEIGYESCWDVPAVKHYIEKLPSRIIAIEQRRAAREAANATSKDACTETCGPAPAKKVFMTLRRHKAE